MGREYERLFGALPRYETPVYLCERVLDAVSQERIRLMRMRLVFSSCAALVSFGTGIAALRAFLSAVSESGFASYASLLVSDTDAVAASGHSFVFALAESFPAIDTVFVLACLAVLIESLRVMVSSAIEWQRRYPTFT